MVEQQRALRQEQPDRVLHRVHVADEVVLRHELEQFDHIRLRGPRRERQERRTQLDAVLAEECDRVGGVARRVALVETGEDLWHGGVFREVVPAAVPGIMFLSGGQDDVEATENLNAINKLGPHPWQFSFSYGRALQAAALKAWQGQDANASAGQAAYLHRSLMNGLAASGKWTPDAEKAAS